MTGTDKIIRHDEVKIIKSLERAKPKGAWNAPDSTLPDNLPWPRGCLSGKRDRIASIQVADAKNLLPYARGQRSEHLRASGVARLTRVQ